VTVVDDIQRRIIVVKPDGGQVSFLGIADINRRLMVPVLARSIIRIEVAPVAGAVFALITQWPDLCSCAHARVAEDSTNFMDAIVRRLQVFTVTPVSSDSTQQRVVL
jgi:hypothetical protein